MSLLALESNHSASPKPEGAQLPGARSGKVLSDQTLVVVSKAIGAEAKVRTWPKGSVVSGRTILVGIEGKETAYVVHSVDADEVIDNRSAKRADITGTSTDLLPVGNSFVTVREYVALLSEELNDPKTVSSEAAVRFILDILGDVVQRHSKGEVHGDIRPENVRIRDGRAALIDGGFRERFDNLDPYKRMYVAPELRAPEKSLGSQAGDVYSFLRLARSMLRPYMGDQRVARLEAQWSWMFDAAFVARPEDRPTATAIRDAFVEKSGGGLRDDVDAFLDGFNAGARALERRDFTWAGGTIRLSNAVAKSVRQEIAQAPETSLYMSPRTSEHLLVWRAVDNSRPMVENQVYVNIKDLDPSLSAIDVEQLPDHIDDRWMNRIHLDFYDKGIGPDHEASLQPRAKRSEAQRRFDDRYLSYIALANEVRNVILNRDQFIHTEQVAALVAGLDLEAESLDVVTMRRWGYFIAVPDHDRWLYPLFQFDPLTGLPSPFVKMMNDARAAGKNAPPDEWATLSLWTEPHHLIEGRVPRDLLWDEESHRDLRRLIDAIAASAA